MAAFAVVRARQKARRVKRIARRTSLSRHAALSDALAAAAKDPDVIQQMQAIGLEPVGGTAEQFAEDIRADLAKWQAVVKQANVKID